MFGKGFRMRNLYQVHKNKIRPKVSQFEELVSATGTLSCIVIVYTSFREGFKLRVTTVSGADLLKAFKSACTDPEICVVGFFVYRLKWELQKPGAFIILPKIPATRILEQLCSIVAPARQEPGVAVHDTAQNRRPGSLRVDFRLCFMVVLFDCPED